MKKREKLEDFSVELARGAIVYGVGAHSDGAFDEIKIVHDHGVMYIVSEKYGSKELHIEKEVDVPDKTAEPMPEPAAEAQPQAAKEIEF
jgi:hypothetical protein